jgi:hypothetical protein
MNLWSYFVSDFSQTRQVQQQLHEADKKLQAMAGAVGAARTVIQYDSERRKRLLSLEVIKAFKYGSESATQAEHEARASDQYKIGLDALQEQRESAEKTIAEYDAVQTHWETQRSLMAMTRETMRQIPE